MPSYVYTYRRPKGQPLSLDQADAWYRWFDEIGEHITLPGDAVGSSRAVGNVAGDQSVSGFSVITARDMEHAVELAQGCPAIAQGYGLEVGELIDVRATA